MVVDTVKHGYDTAMDLLEKNQKKLHELAKYLYEKETITGKQFMEIYRKVKGIPEPVDTSHMSNRWQEAETRKQRLKKK